PLRIHCLCTSLPMSLLILPPLPSSPPFPYTTLFRSHRTAFPRRHRSPISVGPDARLRPVHPQTRGAGIRPRGPPRKIRKLQISLDRKSTRLNSSHVSISYAVFCLKKKKQNAILNALR